jgi:hypothetical protein
MECIHTFGGKTSCKMYTWKAEKELGGNIKLDLREIGCYIRM